MKRNELKPRPGAVKVRKRRGRGNASGLGGESGRGHKGAKSRTGYTSKPGFEGGQTPLYKKLPKRKGFKSLDRTHYEVVNLGLIQKLFSDGQVVDVSELVRMNVVSKKSKVKILGNGDFSKKVTVKAHAFSKSALDKLKAADSEFEVIG